MLKHSLESLQAYATDNNQYPGAESRGENAQDTLDRHLRNRHCYVCGCELMDGYCPNCDEEN